MSYSPTHDRAPLAVWARWTALVLLLCVAGGYFALLGRRIAGNDEQIFIDFKVFHVAGRAALQGVDPYSRHQHEAMSQSIAPLGMPVGQVHNQMIQPPASLLLLAPLIALPYPSGGLALAATSLACAYGVGRAISGLVPMPCATDRLGSFREAALPVAVAFCLLMPSTWQCVTLGQVTWLAIGGATMLAWASDRDRPIPASIATLLACLKPTVTAIPVLICLIAARSRVRWTSMAVLAGYALANAALYARFGFFETIGRHRSASSEVFAGHGVNAADGELRWQRIDVAPLLAALDVVYLQRLLPILLGLAVTSALIWLVVAKRRSAFSVMPIAMLACLSFTYHRQYDAVMLAPAAGLCLALLRSTRVALVPLVALMIAAGGIGSPSPLELVTRVVGVPIHAAVVNVAIVGALSAIVLLACVRPSSLPPRSHRLSNSHV